MTQLPFKFTWQGQQVTRLYHVDSNWSSKELCENIKNEFNNEYGTRNLAIMSVETVLPQNSNILFLAILNTSFNYNTLGFYIQILSSATPCSDEDCCRICLTEKKDVVFIPCRHLATCHNCANRAAVNICIICRIPIQDKMQVYI